MKKHILVVAQYFYPEQFRINDICTEWVKRGYKVTVITGIPNYPQGKYYPGYGLLKKRKEIYNGIEIVRIPLIPRGNSSIMLALNYVSFVVSGFFWSLFTNIKADFVYIYEVSPMTQALPGVWYSIRRKIPCYIYVTDLWPENVQIVTGINNKFIINSIGKIVDYIYKRCNKIFTSSRSFIGAIKKRGVPEGKLEFWPQYAEDFYIPLKRQDVEVKEIPNDDKFNIIFAGNIGVAQGLDILPKTASILKEKGQSVRFNIVGDGRFKETLVSMVNECNVEEMFNFINKQPATRIPDFMAVCDAALVSLSKSEVFSITIPAKTQSCLACGIPMIVSADGEIQDIIRESGAGVCCEASNSKSLADIICTIINKDDTELENMANKAYKYSNEKFNKNKLLDIMDNYFKDMNGEGKYV